MKFIKMHGCGNDYIYIDCFQSLPSDIPKLSLFFSDRHKGIGSDGVVLICKSENADCFMRMFNSDGSEGKMCGNAIRCVTKYLVDNNLAKDKVKIETLSGVKTCEYTLKDGLVDTVIVDMGEPSFDPLDIPVYLSEKMINYPIVVGNETYKVTCLSMGNPHQVIFLDNIKDLKLSEIGHQFENYPLYPQKINTEFIKVVDSRTLDMRVWERGSGETMACGTGACASVVAATINNYVLKDTEITVRLLGGDLFITYTNNRVYMRGEAVKVFEGEIDYED